MTELTAGAYTMCLDIEQTRRYYASHTEARISCDCAGCRNFVRAAAALPKSVTDFFAALGLDPLKPAEACHYYGDAERVFSSAWYHVRGELVTGNPAPGSNQRYGPAFPLADNVSVSAATDCDLLPDDFPAPRFQVEFWFERLPWLLDEPNPYEPSRQENLS